MAAAVRHATAAAMAGSSRQPWKSQVELGRRAELGVPADQELGGECGAVGQTGQNVQAVEGERALAVRAPPPERTRDDPRSVLGTRSIPGASGQPPPPPGTGSRHQTGPGHPR